MRNFSLLLLFLGLTFSSAFAPVPARQTDGQLSEVDRLYYTCKIWGLLKYYHPLVAKGSYNWDEKLQSLISLTAKRTTDESFSEFYSRYLYNMGQVMPCNGCSRDVEDENFDLSWTEDPRFSTDMQKSLKNLAMNPFQGTRKYISQGDAGQFEPKNEGSETGFDRQNKYHRLLPLFRFWNYVEYFYPHKYLLDQTWDDTLKEMIPKFLAAETKLEFELAILELIVKIDDSHAGLVSYTLDQMPYYTFLPARFELVEGQILITEILDKEKAEKANLQVGDIIEAINGRSATEIHEANKKYIWGSNEAVKNGNIYPTLFMGIKEAPEITLRREESVITTTAALYKFIDFGYKAPAKKTPVWEIMDDSIGYADLGRLGNAEVAPMMDAFKDQAFIILDLRNGSRGTARTLANYLNPRDTVFAKILKPDLSYPGKFKWDGERSCGEVNPDYYKGNVVLLVNEKTQNSDEFGCMCLQTAPKVTVIGSQTAGTIGNVSKFVIVDRLYSSMTGIGIHYPDGSPVQRNGIEIGLEVKPTIAGKKEGRDEVLERAIAFAKMEILAAIELQQQMDSLASDTARMDSTTLDLDNDY